MKPIFKILADGYDINDKIKERLISLTVTDEVGFVSDSLSLHLDNHDDKLEIPGRGVSLEVYLGYEGENLVKMGKFMVDEVEISSPPNQMSITARSSDTFEKDNLGGMKVTRNRSWHEITFLEMVTQIASDNKLSPLVAPQLEGIIIDHIDQTDESDLAFLNRVAQTLEAYVKPADGKLIIGLVGKALSPKGVDVVMPTVFLTQQQMISWRVRIAERNKINRVEAKYHDKKKGNLDSVAAGSGKPVFCLTHTYASAVTAQRAAKSKLAELRRGLCELEVSTVGNTQICAESVTNVSGVSQSVDGDWIVKSASHELSSSGYLTKLNAIKKE